MLYQLVSWSILLSCFYEFFLAKVQQGRPWDFIKKKSQKLYKESTTKIKTTQEAEEATGQLRTKKRSQRTKAERLSSDILRAWSLASSKKEHFQEEKEGRPLSNIKLFRCFHMCQAAMMKISIKKGFWYCCFDCIIIWKKSLWKFQCIFKCCQQALLHGQLKKRWKAVYSIF